MNPIAIGVNLVQLEVESKMLGRFPTGFETMNLRRIAANGEEKRVIADIAADIQDSGGAGQQSKGFRQFLGFEEALLGDFVLDQIKRVGELEQNVSVLEMQGRDDKLVLAESFECLDNRRTPVLTGGGAWALRMLAANIEEQGCGDLLASVRFPDPQVVIEIFSAIHGFVEGSIRGHFRSDE